MPSSLKNQQGFTLLELLIVVAIMAIIAGMGLMSNQRTQEYSKEQAVRVEMRQLQQAVIYFFKDQNVYSADSPADIDFLLIENGTADWDPDYRTGWRGPYIKVGDYSTPYVSIADSSDTGLELNGKGSPGVGTAVVVRAKPDPYSHNSIAPYFIWKKLNEDLSVSNPEISRLGRPYLFFDLDTYGNSISKARIVSMGQDGIYEFPLDCDPDETLSTSADYCWCDLIQEDENHARFCTREDVCESLGDDVVLCI